MYSRRRLTGSREPCFSLTMPLHTKNMCLMHQVPKRCGRAPSSVRWHALVDQKCKTQFCQIDPFSHSMTQRTIELCQDGLKECRQCWKSRDYFNINKLGRGLMVSAKTSNAPKEWCCCHHILFNQPNFIAMKSHLEEVINSCSHLCDFNLKFHCELNYIEQYCGAAKLLYRSGPWLKKMENMEKQVAACLDGISLVQIRR